MDIPDQIAAGLEIRVDDLAVPEDWPNGLWVPEQRRIILRRGMDYVTRRCTLAHEVGHAWHRHEKTGHHHYDRRHEDQADAFAALQLIDNREYAMIESAYGHETSTLAYHLDVIPRYIDLWRDNHRRRVPPRNTVNQHAM